MKKWKPKYVVTFYAPIEEGRDSGYPYEKKLFFTNKKEAMKLYELEKKKEVARNGGWSCASGKYPARIYTLSLLVG